jgi:hypothetical protein
LTAKGRSIGEQVTSTETPPGATPPPDPGLSHRMSSSQSSSLGVIGRGGNPPNANPQNSRDPNPAKERNEYRKPSSATLAPAEGRHFLAPPHPGFEEPTPLKRGKIQVATLP